MSLNYYVKKKLKLMKRHKWFALEILVTLGLALSGVIISLKYIMGRLAYAIKIDFLIGT